MIFNPQLRLKLLETLGVLFLFIAVLVGCAIIHTDTALVWFFITLILLAFYLYELRIRLTKWIKNTYNKTPSGNIDINWQMIFSSETIKEVQVNANIFKHQTLLYNVERLPVFNRQHLMQHNMATLKLFNIDVDVYSFKDTEIENVFDLQFMDILEFSILNKICYFKWRNIQVEISKSPVEYPYGNGVPLNKNGIALQIWSI